MGEIGVSWHIFSLLGCILYQGENLSEVAKEFEVRTYYFENRENFITRTRKNILRSLFSCIKS